ncbi:MAG: hypothetical protein U0354_02675 [Candidatus Sericytochromatia bacterium]
MIKKILFTSLLILTFSCNESNSRNNNQDTKKNTEKETSNKISKVSSKPKDNYVNFDNKSNFSPKEDADINKDGVINYKDWNSLSKDNRYKLIQYYNNLTYQSLGLNPSKDIKEKEIKSTIDKLNKIYLSNNSDNKNLDLYELILSFEK